MLSVSRAPHRPNLVFLFADQLRADVLSAYGGEMINTPHLDRLRSQSVKLENMISTCPVCTPYRAMLNTGRHPQTTSMVINSLRPRHAEIGFGDALAAAGYRTAWCGKWHLYTGGWPGENVPDWVPRGRPRLGWQHWRAYNQHMVYFDGPVNSPDEDWNFIRWDGYETEGLNRFGFGFMDGVRAAGDGPFALFLSPHQPHWTPGKWAPDRFYDRLPVELPPPANVPERMHGQWAEHARNYLAMVLAIDDMVGEVAAYLDEHGLADDTLFVFTSDHGTQGGAHGSPFWAKKAPNEESLRVPLLARLPGRLPAGGTCDALTAPVDLMPTILSLLGVGVPRTVEGFDLSDAWSAEPEAFEQDAVFTMNFGDHHDLFRDGSEWRGVRTTTRNYARFLDGSRVLHDLAADPLQMRNLIDDPAHADEAEALEARLREFQRVRGDVLQPCTDYTTWFDAFRRPIRNGYGPTPDPEAEPDWSLLNG